VSLPNTAEHAPLWASEDEDYGQHGMELVGPVPAIRNVSRDEESSRAAKGYMYLKGYDDWCSCGAESLRAAHRIQCLV